MPFWVNKKTNEQLRTYPHLEDLKNICELYRKVIDKEIKLKRIPFKKDIYAKLEAHLQVGSEKELASVVRQIS